MIITDYLKSLGKSIYPYETAGANIEAAARLFLSDKGYTELRPNRILHFNKVSDPNKAKYSMPSGFYDSPEAFVDNARRLALEVSNKAEACALWVSINPVSKDFVTANKLKPNCINELTYTIVKDIDGKPILKKNGKPLAKFDYKLAADDSIACRRYLLIDIDSKHAKDENATEADKMVAFEVATDVVKFLDWELPVIADSGNGIHLLYRVDLPNDTDSLCLLKAVLTKLGNKFNTPKIGGIDVKVHNAARVIKLYGSMSKKGENTPDRPHRLSRFIYNPDSINIVSREKLLSCAGDLYSKMLAAEAPDKEESDGKRTARKFTTVKSTRSDQNDFILKADTPEYEYNVDALKWYLTSKYAPLAIQGEGGHNVIYSVAQKILDKGIADETGFKLLQMYNESGKCKPARSLEELSSIWSCALAYRKKHAIGNRVSLYINPETLLIVKSTPVEAVAQLTAKVKELEVYSQALDNPSKALNWIRARRNLLCGAYFAAKDIKGRYTYIKYFSLDLKADSLSINNPAVFSELKDSAMLVEKETEAYQVFKEAGDLVTPIVVSNFSAIDSDTEAYLKDCKKVYVGFSDSRNKERWVRYFNGIAAAKTDITGSLRKFITG